MNNRPTPDTDAAEAKRRAEWLHKHKAHKDWIILSVSEIAVIRDELLILERERDDLQKAVNGLCEHIGVNPANTTLLAVEVLRIERERDEAQNQLSQIHRWIERNHADGFIDSLTFLQNLERVVDCWHDRIDAIESDARRYLRKSDEAMEKAERYRIEANAMMMQRDEARWERNQLKSLNESYAACWDEIKDALNESEQGDKTCDLDRVLKAIRERNEAQEVLRKAIRFVEAYEPHSRGAEADQNETLSIIRKVLEETK